MNVVMKVVGSKTEEKIKTLENSSSSDYENHSNITQILYKKTMKIQVVRISKKII